MGTGGSRRNAGRPGWRRRCGSMLSLDVRAMRRQGMLQPGQHAGQWAGGASIGIEAQPDRVRLEYGRPSESEPTQCTVWLERLPCRFGGERTYFLCPGCGRRCERIYGLDQAGRFSCRVCLRLAYASESESPEDRTWRRERKLERRLTEEGGKPKGMRWSTYQRIVALIEAQQQKRDGMPAPALERLLARFLPPPPEAE